MIIGISGRIGSGKDTVAEFIQDFTLQTVEDANEIEYHVTTWDVKKFAGKLKQIASILTGATLTELENQEFKSSDMPAAWGMTYRQFLQKLGTDALRDHLHTNIWVNALFSDYIPEIVKGGYQRVVKNEFGIPIDFEREVIYPQWIISDMRFPNEVDAIKTHKGITLRIERHIPGVYVDPSTLHPSETAIDNYNFDWVIQNNGTLADLKEKVSIFLKHFKII